MCDRIDPFRRQAQDCKDQAAGARDPFDGDAWLKLAEERQPQTCGLLEFQLKQSDIDILAEGVGFEPTVPLQARRFSRPVP